jgi:hydroxylamine reductase
MAKKLPAPTEIETGKIVGGFAHAQVIALADKVIDAVKTGAIKKFFVMAGCDGRMKSREYYTDFANGPAQRHGHPDCRLRQIPLQQASVG